jgi:osmoprotectant transport system permease protein
LTVAFASISVPGVLDWFNNPDNWHGANGVPARLIEHLQLCGVALMVACLVAVPIGVWFGHSGRGGLVVLNLANLGRAIPSLAILVIVVPLVGIGSRPAYVALIALAIPPILTNTYVGVREVDAEIKDAARGMGMTASQMIRRVELRLALPFVLAGIRTSAFQLVATAALAAEVAAGGLGRYIVDGLATRDDTQVFAGGLLVVCLALIVEAVIAGLHRALVPKPLRNPNRYIPNTVLEDMTNETLDHAT